MTIDHDPTLSPDALKSALPEAQTLVNPSWLEKERRKRPRDRVLLEPGKALMTSREILHAIKFGLIDEAIHPIAESIIVAETALKTYEQTGASLVSPLFYLVLTLRDIAKSRSLIPGSEPRIQKLMGTEWQSALHELIIACSYLPHPQPELLPESETPTPDIRLKTEPIVYVECKARLKYEQEVIAFTDTWRRESLATIKKIIGEYTCSFVIRVVI